MLDPLFVSYPYFCCCVLQLNQVIDLIGTPHPDEIRMAGASEGAYKYILSQPFKPPAMHKLYKLSSLATHEAVHLLCRMLVFNPERRISVSDALSHPYLDEGRLRYHTCMCSCCHSSPGGRQYCGGNLFIFIRCLTFICLLSRNC